MRKLMTFAGELGLLIAIPIVGLAFLGRSLDRTFGTSPWLLLSGLILSLPIVSLLIYREVQRFRPSS